MKALQKFLLYGFEGFLLLLGLLTIAMLHNGFPKMLPFLLVFFLIGAILCFSYTKKRSVSYVWLFVLTIACAGLGWKLGFSPVIAVLFSAACCWRGAVHFFLYEHDNESVNPFTLLMISIAFALLLFIANIHYAHRGSILTVVVLETAYLFGVKGVLRFNELSGPMKSSFLRSGALGFLILLSGSSLLAAIYSFIRHGLFQAFGTVLKGILAVIAYPFYLLLRKVHFNTNVFDRISQAQNQNGKAKHHLQVSHHAWFHFPHWLIYLFLVLVGAAIFWYLKRKTVPLTALEEAPQVESGPAFEPIETLPKGKRDKVKPPEDEVRKLFFQLQGTLARQGFGRWKNEPVRDWFRRLDFADGLKDEVARAYQKVRYGEVKLSISERRQYEQAIKEMMRQARILKREED